MKICAVGLRGIPDVMGGVETHCQNLYPLLVDSNMDVTVLARSPYVEGSYTYKGVNVVSVWAIRNKLLETILHTFLAVFYARWKVKPDVLHIHAIGPGLMTPLARLLGLKVVVTHHGSDYDREKWGTVAKALLRMGEWCSVRFAHKVIVVGESLTKRLRDEYPKRKNNIVHVPNGATLPSVESVGSGVLKEIDPKIEEKGYFVYVGRLVPEKGIHDLIEAFESSGSTFRLVIVGGVDHEDDYSRSLQRRASDKVIFTGRLQGAQLAAVYKFAYLFVLPSYHEGLPISALEALSARVPVLLSDITPNLDIHLHEGAYFRVGDVAHLRQRLERPELVPEAHVDLVNAYNWPSVSHKTHDILVDLWGCGEPARRLQPYD